MTPHLLAAITKHQSSLNVRLLCYCSLYPQHTLTQRSNTAWRTSQTICYGWPSRPSWNQIASFCYHSPQDEHAARQLQTKQQTRQRQKQYTKTAVRVLLGISVLAAGLVFKTWQDLQHTFYFPNDMSQIGRDTEPYITSVTQPGVKNGRKKKKKFILFPWLQSHSQDMWRLLKLAQSDTRSVRHLGVQAIADNHKWTDAECRMLSQAMDSRTLVGLARTKGADLRLFLPPPRYPPLEEDLEGQLHHLLSSLPSDDLDKCTKYFTSKALQEGSSAAADERGGGLWCFGGNGLAFAESLSPAPPEMVELFCVQALVKHSRLISHCPDIVKLGGLQLMRRIYDVRQSSVKISRQIARVLANLAFCQELHGDIIDAGWVTILARWIQSGDIALTLHATKALANLDRDFGESRLYPDSVYLYYPQLRYREPVYADVIFIHGLLGGPFRTWRQDDRMRPAKAKNASEKNPTESNTESLKSSQLNKSSNSTVSDDPYQNLKNSGVGSSLLSRTGESSYTMCWPQDWLAKDCPNIRILTVEYETHLSEWAPRCPYESEKRTIMTRSKELLEKLKQAGVGDRPIIWVGHSMGGLIIKQMLLLAHENPSLRHLVDQSQGIVFYSVPHRGSPLAATTNQTKYLLYPSVEVKELNMGSPQLLQLHESFKEMMFDVGIPLLSFGEGLKTELPLNLKVFIVPTESSDPGFGEYHILPDHNHLNICKPISKSSLLYELTLEFIRDCIPFHIVEHILRANIPDEYIFPDDLGEKHRKVG